MITAIEDFELFRFCMEPVLLNWVIVSESEMEKAFKTLDHRQDGFGRFYERWNGKPFAYKKGSVWLGSPDYFKK